MAEYMIKWTTFLDVHDPNLSESHKKWRRLLDVYLEASGTNAKTKAQKRATILYCAGNDIILASEHFPWKKEDGSDMSENEKKDPKNLLLMIEEYCNPKQSEVLMSYRFWNVPWSTPFDTFLTELRNRAEACNFQEKDRMIRDKIVFTARGKIQELLLRESDLKLPRAIDICRSYELSSQNVKEMNASNPKSIDKVEKGKQKFTKQHSNDKHQHRERKPGRKPDTKTGNNCQRCGTSHQRGRCPTYGKECHICKKMNHSASKCRYAKSKVHSLENDEDESDEEQEKWLSAVHSSKDTRSYAMMHVNDCKVKFLLDPGATVNCINAQFVRKSQLNPAKSQLYMWNKAKQKCLGEVQLKVTNPKNIMEYKVNFSVVKNDLQCILDAETCRKMELITVHEEKFQVAKVESRNSIGDLGESMLTVDPKVSAKVLPCRKIPIAIEKEVHDAINELVEREILIPVDEPTKWVSQMAAARKANGKIRICIDPQPLNKALLREHYKLPTFDDVRPKLLNSKVFSKVDVKEAFWHIKLDKESSMLTTMITPMGRYKWTRLPFGLKVSSEIFQKRLHHVLNDLEGVVCVGDDIIILGRGSTVKEAEEDHKINLDKLLKRCQERKIILNESKMDIKKTQIDFLGHQISKEGIQPSQENVKAIQEMPVPEDVTGVHRLCGMVQYLARYTPNLADDLEPIHQLTRKDVEFIWSKECDDAFKRLKQKMSNSPVLGYYNPEEELVLQVDSSEKGLGAVLLQEGKPLERFPLSS